MLENTLKQKPELATIIKEATESLASVSEPMKSKIKKAFDALDNIAIEMKTYQKVDELMDDSASDLTLLSGIDVRVNGVHHALARVIHSSDQARAIIDTTNWLIAKAMKGYIANE